MDKNTRQGHLGRMAVLTGRVGHTQPRLAELVRTCFQLGELLRLEDVRRAVLDVVARRKLLRQPQWKLFHLQ